MKMVGRLFCCLFLFGVSTGLLFLLQWMMHYCPEWMTLTYHEGKALSWVVAFPIVATSIVCYCWMFTIWWNE